MSLLLSSEAVVLKAIHYSDTSLILRLFTEQYGKVTVIAKGARRPRHGAEAILHPPNHITVWYQFKEDRDIQTLTKQEYVTRFTKLSTDLAKSTAAMVAIEMLDRAVHGLDPHPILFRLITSTLAQLDQPEDFTTTLLHFYELHLARHLGFAPHLDHCPRCGQPLIRGILDRDTGELICDRCPSSGSLFLEAAALDYLRYLEKTHITQLQSHPTDRNTCRVVDDFLPNYLFLHVDGMSNLKSLKFWRQVQA